MDPVADSTDLYAFVSPDRPNTVTLIANYIPLQAPAGGPNFYQFGDDVRYAIHIDNDGDGKADITYSFTFHNRLRDPETFLYNTGPITALNSPNWNTRQFYSVHRSSGGGGAGAGLAATAIAGTLTAPAAAATVSATPRAHPGRQAGVPSPAEPVIVHIRDLRSGEMDVFAGEATARLRDPGLAARLVHAVR